MAKFDDLRESIARTVSEREENSRAQFLLRNQTQKLQTRIAQLSRSNDDKAAEQIKALQQQADRLAGEKQRLEGEFTRLKGVETGLLTDFAQFADPRENIGLLDDTHPILLFPLRIETRFKRVQVFERRLFQLWVRVYPDDITVDTFEDLLADVELKNAKTYWTNIWRAGGNDGENRAAWQTLVSSHGSGRAHWIIGQYVPLNVNQQPVKAEKEFILVIASTNPLPTSERDAVAKYWTAVWNAKTDAAAAAVAFDQLVLELGDDESRANEIRTGYAPANLGERPTIEITQVTVAFLDLPPDENFQTQQRPWGRPALTRILPERLVLLGYNNGVKTLDALGAAIPSDLIIGPDPDAAEADQIHIEDGELVVPEPLRWMIDFEEALAKGMAFRINLTADQAQRGFDQLFVVGVNISSDLENSKKKLESLIAHHQASRKGLSIVGQGTPTNNTEADPSGYTWVESPDTSYDHFFGTETTDDSTDWRLKRDGRWLANFLGVNPAILKDSVNYFAQDQAQARAMNTALWPATLGYFMDRMMAPVFSDNTIEQTRDFFTRFVSGRGPIPAVRVGKQPYGILPATAFSRMNWLKRSRRFENVTSAAGTGFDFLSRLYAVLLKIDEQWTTLSQQAAFVGKAGDPHQNLLDVVGLHPTSAEFYNRYAQSADQILNQFRYYGLAGGFLAALIQFVYTQSGINLLATFGYTAARPEEVPEILHKFFLSNADRLAGPTVDDKVLSETDPIRAYFANGDNYIDWLITAAKTSHDTLRRQEGFLNNRTPMALLYLMLQHALDLSFVDTSIILHVNAGLMTADVAKTARMDPRFIHVQPAARDVGSPWQYLYKAEPAITQSQSLSIGDYIPTVLTVQRPYLQTQIEALQLLADAPTAQLERAFTEHIDCCSYRFDSWLLGLVHAQLALMRNFSSDGEESIRDGSHLGVFGWVEDLRPENKNLQPVQLPSDLAAIFQKEDEPVLQRDPTNGGHILAPSLNHAVTAAVLRNGYISNASPSNPDAFSINLTSERVRRALGIIEGIRNGQTLGALLGYQLERELHDQESLFLDDIIFELRAAFPLVANKTGDTQPEEDAAIQSLEARNVVDGLSLIAQVRKSGVRAYPFGLSTLPDIPNLTRRNAVNDAVDRMFDTNDAVADVAMAESVHQVVQGNYDRAAGTFDAYSKGNFPPLPDVVQTPRSGVTLTHRVGIHFEGGLDPADAANTTPRSKGEPAINRWLSDMLPDPSDIACQVEFFDRVTAATVEEVISAADLNLLPIDLLYLVTLDRAQAMAALDDVILHYVVNNFTPRIDFEIKIQYTTPIANKVTFFEIAPLIRSLRSCLLKSRPLRSSDLRLQGEAQKADEDVGTINIEKINGARAELQTALGTWNTFITTVTAALTGIDDEAIIANAVNNIDQIVTDFMDAALSLTKFGIPAAGIGSSLEWERARFTEAIAKLAELIDRWQQKLVDFQDQLDAYDALDLPSIPTADKFANLAIIERILSTLPLQPPSPEQFRIDLETIVRPSFQNVFTQLNAIMDNGNTVRDVYAGLAGLAADIAAHDAVPFDLTNERKEIRRYAEELKSRAESMVTDITSRITRADGLVTDSATKSPAQKIDALTQAIRLLLDSDFAILPEFSLAADTGTEVQSSLGQTADLLSYLITDLKKDFPIDEWLYGVARTREKMGQLEASIMLIEALTNQEFSLAPVQLPLRSPDFWLALDHPDKLPGTETPFAITEDKLLYTAHFHVTFDATSVQCGLLLDEWTEVIPKKEETAGLTFHYDRPNCEPPQTLLLVTPSDFTGEWKWDDLVDALRETLALAKKRAVEPTQIDQTAYARFLPAVISSVTTFPIMMSLNFSFNNAIQFRERNS
ncbi:MAG TPA: hypothetical protein VIW80_18145 [Pyrinomonadaceae bacterium]